MPRGTHTVAVVLLAALPFTSPSSPPAPTPRRHSGPPTRTHTLPRRPSARPLTPETLSRHPRRPLETHPIPHTHASSQKSPSLKFPTACVYGLCSRLSLQSHKGKNKTQNQQSHRHPCLAQLKPLPSQRPKTGPRSTPEEWRATSPPSKRGDPKAHSPKGTLIPPSDAPKKDLPLKSPSPEIGPSKRRVRESIEALLGDVNYRAVSSSFTC
nr:extensin-like [Penaeus vannamei]